MVSILLMTHGQIGLELLETAKNILGQISTPTACLSLNNKSDVNLIKAQAAQLLKRLDRGQGVLIITDLYGATPHNIAHALSLDHPGNTHSSDINSISKAIVSGLNLPMLLRALNYAQDLSLEDLAEKTTQGGHLGITCQQVEINISAEL